MKYFINTPLLFLFSIIISFVKVAEGKLISISDSKYKIINYNVGNVKDVLNQNKYTFCNDYFSDVHFSTVINKHSLGIAIEMADSHMKYFPEVGINEPDTYYKRLPTWNYVSGFISYAYMQLWELTKNRTYFDYAKAYAEKFIDDNGNIEGYNKEAYNLDNINSGKFLFNLFKKTGEERYNRAILVLANQLREQPRTTEGGFWHKAKYPYQIWLDGLYMGAPFYAQYAKEFNEPQLFDDVVNQFKIAHKHTFDQSTKLNYHAWDEKRAQNWSNPVTGCSANFWGRAYGWFAMALVDVLDHIPTDHSGRSSLMEILNQVVQGIQQYQDKESGLWYQVIDKGDKKGNYLEASASAMYIYTLLKATRLNYIEDKYKNSAIKGYYGILEKFIQQNHDNTISLTSICSMAGLSDEKKRDGSYEYYINEPIVSDDGKGVAPFILASIEMNLAGAYIPENKDKQE